MNVSPILISVFMSFLIWFYIRQSFIRNFIKIYHWPKFISYFLDFFIFYTISFRFLFRHSPLLLRLRPLHYLFNLSYIIMGFIGLIIFVLIILDLEHLIHTLTTGTNDALDSKNQEKNGRRDFLKKSFTLTGVFSSSVITGVGLYNSFEPKLKKVLIKLDNQFISLRGMKIIQISDVHLGPTLKKEFAQNLVKQINFEKPDLIVITGDLIDGEVSTIKEDVEPLKNLSSKLGTFYVTGNHEYYWNAKNWIEYIPTLGINVLQNSNQKLIYNNTKFSICGVNDLYSKRYDPKNAPDYIKAKENIPDNYYKILLAHQPKACFEASRHGFNLQLSGHTHAGQGFPWNIIVYFVQPYLHGLYRHDQMDLYVSAGTGFWGPPNRFLIDPEITLIELT